MIGILVTKRPMIGRGKTLDQVLCNIEVISVSSEKLHRAHAATCMGYDMDPDAVQGFIAVAE